MSNQQIISELETLIRKLKSLEFEDRNFCIVSDGWKKVTVDGKSYLENNEKDVWEILDGNYKGEQLFTWDAAIRETKKSGKKLPTKDDFSRYFSDNKTPTWPKAGYRSTGDGGLGSQGSGGNYWSSSPNDSYAYGLNFGSGGAIPAYSDNRAYGFSVRCLKD